jgi:hypothetical protein
LLSFDGLLDFQDIAEAGPTAQTGGSWMLSKRQSASSFLKKEEIG